MTDLLRAVFDTNVFVAAALSKNPTSPTRELLNRWESGEFAVITCSQLVEELFKKLRERHAELEDILDQAAALLGLAEWVMVPAETVPSILSDPDDDIVLACALLGNATHIVT